MLPHKTSCHSSAVAVGSHTGARSLSLSRTPAEKLVPLFGLVPSLHIFKMNTAGLLVTRTLVGAIKFLGKGIPFLKTRHRNYRCLQKAHWVIYGKGFQYLNPGVIFQNYNLYDVMIANDTDRYLLLSYDYADEYDALEHSIQHNESLASDATGDSEYSFLRTSSRLRHPCAQRVNMPPGNLQLCEDVQEDELQSAH